MLPMRSVGNLLTLDQSSQSEHPGGAEPCPREGLGRGGWPGRPEVIGGSCVLSASELARLSFSVGRPQLPGCHRLHSSRTSDGWPSPQSWQFRDPFRVHRRVTSGGVMGTLGRPHVTRLHVACHLRAHPGAPGRTRACAGVRGCLRCHRLRGPYPSQRLFHKGRSRGDVSAWVQTRGMSNFVAQDAWELDMRESAGVVLAARIDQLRESLIVDSGPAGHRGPTAVRLSPDADVPHWLRTALADAELTQAEGPCRAGLDAGRESTGPGLSLNNATGPKPRCADDFQRRPDLWAASNRG